MVITLLACLVCIGFGQPSVTSRAQSSLSAKHDGSLDMQSVRQSGSDQILSPTEVLSLLLLALDSRLLFNYFGRVPNVCSGTQSGTMPAKVEVYRQNLFSGATARSPSSTMTLVPTIITVAAALAASSIKVIGTAETMLIERLGRFNRQLSPGLHFIIPVLERNSFVCTTREQVLDIPPQACITKDNAPLSADAVVYWKIFDPELARYAVKDLVLAIQNLVLTQLRSEIGKLTLDETFSARQKMNTILLEDLDRATDAWGIKVTRVEVRDIMPSKDIMEAMEMQMSAERKKRANILESEGRRESQVNDARGAADAVRLQAEAEASRLETVAEGEARSLKKLTEAMGDKDYAVQIALLSKYWKTQAELASSDNAKVLFYPSKATVPISVEGLRDMLVSE